MLNSSKFSTRLSDYISNLRDEVTAQRLLGGTPRDDAFANINIRVTEIDKENDKVHIESDILTHNMSPLFATRNLLFELYNVIAEHEDLGKKLDLALIIKVPDEFTKELGESIQIRMGEDLGELKPFLRNKIVDAILNWNIDKQLLKMFSDGEKKRKSKTKKKTTAAKRKKKGN